VITHRQPATSHAAFISEVSGIQKNKLVDLEYFAGTATILSTTLNGGADSASFDHWQQNKIQDTS
jgi:hypothetical protein